MATELPDPAVLASEARILTSRGILDRVVDELSLVDDPEVGLNGGGWLDSFLCAIEYWLARIVASLGGSHDPGQPLTSDGSTQWESAQQARAKVVNNISKRLSAEIPKSSALISVSYRSSDADKAASIVNSVIRAYLDEQVKGKQSAISETSNQLRDHIEHLRNEVKSADQNVQSFRNQHDLLKTSGVPALVQRLDELTLSEARAETEAADGTARLRLLRSIGPNSAANLPLSNSTDIQLMRELKLQESNIRARLAAALTSMGNAHPMVLDLKAQLIKIQAQVIEEFNRMLAGLERDAAVLNERQQQLSEAVRTTRSEVKRQNDLESELDRLISEASSKRSAYETSLAAYNRTSMLENSQVPDIRAIYYAEPPAKPAFPRPLMLALASLVSVIAAAGFVPVFHRFRRLKSLTAREFEQRYDVPVLGLTPCMKNLNQAEDWCQHLNQQPVSEYTESIRCIRNVIDAGHPDNGSSRSVAIVSALAGEGKSTLAVSLATAWAHAGMRTLLMDCDIRRPALAHLLKNENGEESSECLSRVAVPESIRTSPHNGFDLLLAGAHLNDPSYGFGSNAVRELLGGVHHRYDRILLDMPPILAVSDAAVGAAMADLVILVTRWGHTSTDAMRSAIERLRKLAVPRISVVFSQVDLKRYSTVDIRDQYSFYNEANTYYAPSRTKGNRRNRPHSRPAIAVMGVLLAAGATVAIWQVQHQEMMPGGGEANRPAGSLLAAKVGSYTPPALERPQEARLSPEEAATGPAHRGTPAVESTAMIPEAPRDSSSALPSMPGKAIDASNTFIAAVEQPTRKFAATQPAGTPAEKATPAASALPDAATRQAIIWYQRQLVRLAGFDAKQSDRRQ